jgi:hypothetical protein
MLAVHLENLLFLLLLVVAGLFKLLGRAARKARGDEAKPTAKPAPRLPRPIPRAPVGSDEERVRKFLEALGHPPGSSPPAPVAPRPTYRKPLVLPHVPPLGSPLPPLVTRPRDMPQEIRIPPSMALPPAPTQQTPPPVGEVIFAVHETGAPPEPIPSLTSAIVQEDRTQSSSAAPRRNIDVAALLRSSSGLRNAVIVREILGPPRSLRMQTEFGDGIS